SNCMVHSGFEATAVMDTVKHPIKAYKIWKQGFETKKPMVEDIDITKARKSKYVFDNVVSDFMKDTHEPKASAPKAKEGKAKETHAA
ncbi:MAG: hypothetical protein V3R64_04470, partial [Sphingomonadales bacterium]